MAMRTLQVDFRGTGRVKRWPGLALLAAGLAAALLVGNYYKGVKDDLAEAQTSAHRLEAAQRKMTAAGLFAGDAKKAPDEVKQAGIVYAQINAPWDSLFKSLESANTPESALLSIESDNDKHRVKISGEAKNLMAMLNYTRSLEGQTVLTDVYLQSHSVQQQDPLRPVRFIVTADWTANR